LVGFKRGLVSGLFLAVVAGNAMADSVSVAPETAFLDPAAAERLARRAARKSGSLQIPLPDTPDTETPLTRLAVTGVTIGARVMVRIFKAESELEVWVERYGSYVKFASYPVCYWSGKLGPKLREGDRQTPEGFYTITTEQLHNGGRWRRALDIGFPNAFDLVHKRSGSAILIHGGCDSIGCFAMTDAVNAELYDIVSAALRTTKHIPVHVFPFRMTDTAVAALPEGAWTEFWGDLKQGYDAFERRHLPPRISVCGSRYRVADAVRGGIDATAVEVCLDDVMASLQPVREVREAAAATTASVEPSEVAKVERVSRAKAPKARRTASSNRGCSMARASCRRYAALRQRGTRGEVAAYGLGATTRKRSQSR
jgi:murein L,D-transpeptidase YafK